MPFPIKTDRHVGLAWKILAPAKLNLYLEVLGRRADGFHNLETLMVPVRIYDQLSYRATPNKPLTLRVQTLTHRNQGELPLGDVHDNLVVRAAKLLAESAGVSPTGQFHLIKRIPVQAGMGGGSSDAAAALLLANEAWQLGYTQEQLMTLAAQLGSDVPFFVRGGGAICRGRGELVEPMERLPRLHFVIAKPPIGLSTPEVFGELSSRLEPDEQRAESSKAKVAALVALLRKGALYEAGCKMTNRLESAACTLAPWLRSLRDLFSTTGCVAQFMTGSGSAYVGVMRSARHARRAAGWLKSMKLGEAIGAGHVFATASC